MVTSDRDIASYAWSSGSVPVPAGNFLITLERGMIRSDSDGKEYDGGYIEPYRKGNPKRLSKKEKAIRRALSRL